MESRREQGSSKKLEGVKRPDSEGETDKFSIDALLSQ